MEHLEKINKLLDNVDSEHAIQSRFMEEVHNSVDRQRKYIEELQELLHKKEI